VAASKDGMASATGDCQRDATAKDEFSTLPDCASESLPSDAQVGDNNCESPYNLGPAKDVTDIVVEMRGAGAKVIGRGSCPNAELLEVALLPSFLVRAISWCKPGVEIGCSGRVEEDGNSTWGRGKGVLLSRRSRTLRETD